MEKIGFMQGRLSEIINGKIQSFPDDNWENEFRIGSDLGFKFIEWTLDMENIYKNPLMDSQLHEKIKYLSNKYSIKIASLTGDCFMQKPFWKTNNREQELLKKLFLDVVDACYELEMKYIVVPLVDNGRIENLIQENVLIEFLKENQNYFVDKNIVILFESDFDPKRCAEFINKLPNNEFGINYDMGNSASLGFNPIEEFKAYGGRIMNVHVKDRLLYGDTVRLGRGNVDFNMVFNQLKNIRYKGNFIIQGARSKEGKHQQILNEYKEFTNELISRHEI